MLQQLKTGQRTGFGYQMVMVCWLEISDSGLHTYQLTSISCIPGWTAERQNASKINESVFTGRDTVRLSDGPSEDIKHLHLDGTVSDIVLHRISERPPKCTQRVDNSPDGNYAVFWQTFAEQYPFFSLRKMDWKSVDRKFRPQVSSETPLEQLFEILRQMIEPLKDAHTGIAAMDIKKDFDGWRKDSNHLDDGEWARVQELIATRYIQGSLRSFCNGRLQFGMLDHGIGYLRISAFYGYVDRSNYGDALAALQYSLDTIFTDESKLKDLVVDVRLNHGGDDALGLEIASRLANARYLSIVCVPEQLSNCQT